MSQQEEAVEAEVLEPTSPFMPTTNITVWWNYVCAAAGVVVMGIGACRLVINVCRPFFE